jgi:hypothetical protein
LASLGTAIADGINTAAGIAVTLIPSAVNTINGKSRLILNPGGVSGYFKTISMAFNLLTGITQELVGSVSARTFSYTSLQYTPYFDVTSPELHRSNKGDETSNRASSAILFRVFFNSLTMEIDPHVISDFNNTSGGKKLLFTPYDSSYGSLQFQLVDRFGNPLAVASGTRYNITLEIEYSRPAGRNHVGQ